MPNWTHNTIQFDNKADFEKICSECCINGAFDFNTIIPMPELLKFTLAGSEQWALRAFTANYNMPGRPEDIIDRFVAYRNTDLSFEERQELANGIRCYREYGFDTWYEWRWTYWGTKWNAVNTQINEEKMAISFDTAWSAPVPVFEAIAKKYPKLSCSINCQDE